MGQFLSRLIGPSIKKPLEELKHDETLNNGVSNGYDKHAKENGTETQKLNGSCASGVNGIGASRVNGIGAGGELDYIREYGEDLTDGYISSITMKELDPKHFYKMDHKNRGIALIFNHKIFDAHKVRTGTDKDRDRLEQTLRTLNFDVKIHENKSIDEIKEILDEVAAMDHSDNDCLMIVMLTHGDLVPFVRKRKEHATIVSHDLVSYLHASDNKYPINMIWERFTDDQCPSLVNKPKIFLIQACQGKGEHEGYGSLAESTSKKMESKPRIDIGGFKTPKYLPFELANVNRKKNLPQKDFIVVYSTMPGYYSYRDLDHGTWFIESLCNVLNSTKRELDFNQILTIVNRTVAIEYETPDESMKQMPCVVSMLRKLLVFTPKKTVTNAVNGTQNNI